jgi:hypothetical protein
MISIFKNKTNLLLAVGIAFVSFSSCKKDTEEEVDPVVTPIVNENDVPNGITTVNYSVQVVPEGNVRGLTNATVTVQYNGITRTVTVDGSGIAVFDNLSPGHVSGYVKADGYSAINFTAVFTETNNTSDANHVDYAASTIYLIKNNSALQGRVYGDYDLDGNSTISQATNFQTVKMWMAYNLAGYPLGSGNGALASVAMDTTFFVTNSDIAGNFTFSNVPSTSVGVTAKIGMEDVKKTDIAGNTIIFSFAPIPVTLDPELTTHLSDILAF